jgi:hypothetical protein
LSLLQASSFLKERPQMGQWMGREIKTQRI